MKSRMEIYLFNKDISKKDAKIRYLENKLESFVNEMEKYKHWWCYYIVHMICFNVDPNIPNHADVVWGVVREFNPCEPIWRIAIWVITLWKAKNQLLRLTILKKSS